MSADFATCYPLKRGRAHEVCGPGATYFAATCCNFSDKPVLWVCPSWQQEMLNPEGFAAYCDPARLLLARAASQIDLLAVSEEALRSGTVGLVVTEIFEPLSLTHGRRLQLAAEAGRTTGLILMPEGMGSNATETRWRCTPLAAGGDSTLQCWELIKNKSGTFTDWVTRWDAAARRIIVVSKTGERPRVARTAG
ncbi:hypothetical protein TG4357_02968 [Thalassovita gelatinovora]|uniref:Protein ImuA n=1 Tax=Thalassovita gelatinovora TaxID=53501 RepID=A0A0N7LVV7_THAGE|nr:hypothetical protein [Thalassovita gelatinovora]QIZ81963.1 hypothetical protein HFZ77_16475 [Thalassovita gelatinovora]CUH67370.1 hypothetical protein TG4357_02968 [Thalassovita gelatinovora]SEP75394.1 protein ImuA [Thalassovita gelatinovora]